MKKLRIAIIGTGGITKDCHLPAYAEMDNIEIVALCDIKIEKAQALADEYNVEKVFADYKDVLNMPEVDAVDICTPNYLHSIIAVEAFGAGKHVFCEKPDAINVSEAEKMKKASEDAGKLLMVMRNNRYWSSISFLKKYIAGGNAGEIYAGRCGWQRRRGIPGKGGWFTTKELSGGGPLIDLGVHMIDVAIWLMGNPRPTSVSGSIYTKFADTEVSDSVDSKFGEKVQDGIFDVEDLSMGFIKFDNGACLQIEFSWASNVAGDKRFVELRGTKSGISWLPSEEEQIKIFSEICATPMDIIPKLKNSEDKIHKANLVHFVDVILNGTKPDFIPEQGVNMIKILEAMYKSAETGHEVRI